MYQTVKRIEPGYVYYKVRPVRSIKKTSASDFNLDY